MTRLRDHAHIFIIAFAVVFIAFWVVSDVDVGSVLQGSANQIGVINGTPVTYQEFTSVVERVVESQRKQAGGKDLEENQIASIREQVWNDYIQRAVIEEAVKNLGITVADREITDWVRSENPPDAIAQYFRDSTGRFNREQYLQFLNNPGPENEQALVQIEEQLRSELLSQKLTTALTASVQLGDGELLDLYRSQNQQFDVNFILFDPAKLVPKDTIYPTRPELEEYYNAHKYEYRNEDMRKLQFVSFLDVPSHDDTALVITEMENIAKEAQAGKDFIQLLSQYSEQPYQDTWYTLAQIPPEQAAVIYTKPAGSLVGPVKDPSGILLIKVMEFRDGKETFTHARHILIRPEKSDDAARAKAMEVFDKIRAGMPFAEAADKYSDDKSNSTRGGDLGYFSKGRMVKAFEEACFNGKVGELIGPVKTDFGYHIIRVDDRSNREVKYAMIRMAIKPSARTKDQAYENARNFAYFAQENGFEKEATVNKYEVRETGEFAKQRGSYIPEIGVNPSLMKWAFEGNIGDMSDVYKAMSGYVVCKIADIIHAGYRPLDMVEKDVANKVQDEKRLRKTGEIAKTHYAKLRPGAPLQSILPADSSLRFLSSGPFTMQQGVPVIGRDFRFMGHVSGMKAGEASKPFRGDHAYFIAQLVSKTPIDTAAFRLQKDDLRRQQLQQKQNEYIQAWLEKMRDNINVVDNRDRFFR